MSQRHHFLTLSFCVCAGAITLASPLLAQDAPSAPGTWRSTQDEEACRLEFVDPDNQVQISFAQFTDSYSIGGLLLAPVEVGNGATPEIAVIVGGKRINFWGPPELMSQSGQDQPIAQLRESLEGEDSLVFYADGTRTLLPLATMPDANAAMGDCLAEPDFASASVRGPRLISFDGMEDLGREASRQRILSQDLGYTITVDPAGKPIKCELSRTFRRKATEIALCRPMLKSMNFEPARDANGTAIEGTYSSVIYFDMWMSQRGYIEEEDR